MMKRLLFLAAMCLVCLPAWGRGKLQGWCEDGGKAANVASSSTSTPQVFKFQQSFPSCTVTVYFAGTTTIATLYSDMSGTAKANPFTASSTGQWFFYADDGSYDVKFSGGGISTPFTLGAMSIPIGTLSVKAFGATGNGSTNDYAAIISAQAVAILNNACLYFPAATYAYATAMVISDDKTCWKMEPGTVLKYTGAATAIAFTFDGTGAANGKAFYSENLRVDANALASTAAIRLKKWIGGIATNMSATNTSGIGIQCSWCVLSTMVNPTVSNNYVTFTTVPSVGLQMDDTAGAGTFSSANTIINPRMEGITTGTGTGIIDKSQGNTYIGGASESNDIGISVTSTGQRNIVTGLFMESNGTNDILCAGFLNSFYGVVADGGTSNFTATSYDNIVLGGNIGTLTITAGAQNIRLENLLIQTSMTDSGTNTTIHKVRNNSSGFYDDVWPNPIKTLTVKDTGTGATQLNAQAGPSGQGATNIVQFKDSGGTVTAGVTPAAEVFSNVIRIGGGASSIWHLTFSGTTLSFTKTGASDKLLLDTNGVLYPNSSGQFLGDSTHQWRLYDQVVATASLPAGGASNDGVIIIEDAGAGTKNLIIYAGGQRFRISGGAPF